LVLGERATSLCDGGIEIVDSVEMFVDQRLVDERLKVLGGLEFWAVKGLVEEPDAVRDGKVFRAVPTGIVERLFVQAARAAAFFLRPAIREKAETDEAGNQHRPTSSSGLVVLSNRRAFACSAAPRAVTILLKVDEQIDTDFETR
jgi:hypothetical protein